MSTPYEPEARQRARESSVGELFGEVSRDLSTLIRQEVELAKAEVKQDAANASKGVGMFAGAGIAGHFVLLFLSLALWWALGGAFAGEPGERALGLSGLVVALLWAIIAAILALAGKAQMRRMQGLRRTGETVKKIPDALKGNETS